MDTRENQIKEIRERWSAMSDRIYCKAWLYEVIRHGERNMSNLCDHTTYSYGNSSSDESNSSSSDDNSSSSDDTPHPDRYDGEIFAYSSHDINILLNIIDNLQKELEQTKLEISLMPGGDEYLKAKDHFYDIQK